MMFVHHFFGYPSWHEGFITYEYIDKYAFFLQEDLKILVPVFAFLTGYFYYFSKRKKYKDIFIKIIDFLTSYWLVFLIFALIAIVFTGYCYNWIEVIEECFGLFRPTMKFCWYVFFYISSLLLLPIITKAMNRNIHLSLLIVVLITIPFRLLAFILSGCIFDQIFLNLTYLFPVTLMGYLFASNNWFQKIDRSIKKKIIKKFLITLLMLILIFTVMFLRLYLTQVTIDFGFPRKFCFYMDVIYAPVFVYATVSLLKIYTKILDKLLSPLGRLSMLMWFSSCIFFANSKTIFMPILYMPKFPLFVLIWGLLLCFAFSFCIDKIIIIAKKAICSLSIKIR